MNTSVKALVFFSFRSHKKGYIEKLFGLLKGAADKRGDIDLSRGSLADLHISTKDSQLAVRDSLTDRDLKEFDVIYFELWQKAPQQALAAARYATKQSVPFLSKEPAALPSVGKVAQLASLSDSTVRVPDSFASSNRELKKVFRNQAPFDYPVIVKSINGFGGRDNFLVNSYEELCELLDSHKDTPFITQSYIENDGDYRCLVLGGEIKLVIQRSRRQGAKTHLNNTSQGAIAELVPVSNLSQQAQDMVLDAARLTNRSEFSGVDLIIGKILGKPYILEVNEAPEIETGVEVDQKMSSLFNYMSDLAKGARHEN